MSDAETVAPTEAPLDHDSVGDDLNPATIPPESDVASEPACNAEEACSLDPQQAVFPLDLQPAENDAQDAYPQHGDQDLLQMTYLQMTTNETVIHLTRMISVPYQRLHTQRVQRGQTLRKGKRATAANESRIKPASQT